MDDEKLIIISYQDEILDSFVRDANLNIGFGTYIINNGLEIIDILEFEAFVQVNVEFK